MSFRLNTNQQMAIQENQGLILNYGLIQYIDISLHLQFN